MKTKYTIYVGRFCVARITATLGEATVTWNAIADSHTGRGVVALYEGRRSIDNLCAKFCAQ